MPNARVIRIGTRTSLLARAQSQAVAGLLRGADPSLAIELVPIVTSGDRMTDQSLADFGGKGLFTKELELALLDHRIDLAVHSFKDVPITQPLVDPAGLVIAAVPVRADARDALIVAESLTGGRCIADLPKGARVGTGSLRRQCQLLSNRPDILIEPIRGNIDTRLKRLGEGRYDAIILAVAGLRRAGLWNDRTMFAIEPTELLPAAGQGALAVQCRADDVGSAAIALPINDVASATCVQIERHVVQLLNGDCHSPIGVLATLQGMQVQLSVMFCPPTSPALPKWATSSAHVDKAPALAQALCKQVQGLS